MNAPQNSQNQNQDNEPSERSLDDNVWYNARPVSVGMGESGTHKDQIILHLEIDPGDGQWMPMTKFNDISTNAGREITMGDVRAFGCEGFRVSQWQATVNRNARFSVILKTTQYQEKWTQKIDRINVNTRKPEYTPQVIAQKEVDLEELFAQADAARIKYLENKALSQMGGGSSGGRSNSLPADPGDGSAASDFGRGPPAGDAFSTPAGNGARRNRF